MKKIVYFFFLSLFSLSQSMFCSRPELVIIVPGTWGMKEKWYKPGGDFFEALQKSALKLNKKVIWFRWLTYNYESYRQGGSEELAHFLNSLDQDINIVAHSHGANIALGACQILAKINPGRKIKTLYTLAVPVHEETYTPAMNIIEKLYNLYSFNDWIQTIWGYQRTFIDHPRIFNMNIFINDKEPTHTEVHHPYLAKWLLHIPQSINANHCTVHFEKEKFRATIENNLKEKIKNDTPINLQALFYSRKKT